MNKIIISIIFLALATFSIKCFSQNDSIKVQSTKKIYLKFVNQSTYHKVSNQDLNTGTYFDLYEIDLFQFQPYVVFKKNENWYFQIGLTDIKYLNHDNGIYWASNTVSPYNYTNRNISLGSTFELYRSITKVKKIHFNLGMGINPIYSYSNSIASLELSKKESVSINNWTIRLLFIPELSYELNKLIGLNISIPFTAFSLNYFTVRRVNYISLSNTVSNQPNSEQNLSSYFEILECNFLDYIGIRCGLTVKIK